ncbi:MAG: hypothetical protein V1704_02905 [Candidatus Vogelbacteria bacterium]
MNMVATISKQVTKGEELVVIPRREYNELQEFKRIREFTPTLAEKRVLKKARLDYKKGNYLTIDELRQKLGFARS